MIRYVDAHTHAQFPAYDGDRELVLARAREAGVSVVNVGTDIVTSRAAVELARENPGLCYATIGLHPVHAVESFGDAGEGSTGEAQSFDEAAFRDLAGDPSVLAIGECGLDYFHVGGELARARQAEIFIQQIEFAGSVGKPLMIHCRNAFPDLIKLLGANRSKLRAGSSGIIHFFAGTAEEARSLLDLGFSFTFGGALTFPEKPGKPNQYREIVEVLPIDRVLSETDAPYVAPASHRGKRNEPAYVTEVVSKLAEVKRVSIEMMAEQILQNARQVFGRSF